MLVGAPRLRASLTPAPDLNIARSEKMLILEMGFVLSSAPSILQRFLIAVVPYWCVIPGKTLEAVHEAVLWSWQAAFRGLRPGRALHVILVLLNAQFCSRSRWYNRSPKIFARVFTQRTKWPGYAEHLTVKPFFFNGPLPMNKHPPPPPP
jgi:hypothetical protein